MKKILFIMLLLVVLVAACGDETTSEDADEKNEGIEADEGSNVYADDQQITFGEAGIYDSEIGTFEIMLNSVRAEEDDDGELPSNDLFVITEVTIKNVSDEAIDDASDIVNVLLFNDSEFEEFRSWSIGFGLEKLEPGESITGEIAFDVLESSYYELVFGGGLGPSSNTLRIRFDLDEFDVH